MAVGDVLKFKSGRKAVVVKSAVKRRGGLRSKKAVKTLINKVINSKAETKMVAFYGGNVGQPSPLQNCTGIYSDAALVAHNQFITSNTNDILKVIPDVAPQAGAASDNARVGRVIDPVSGKLTCRIQISPVAPGSGGWKNNIAYDLTVVAYLLQSVSYKSYRSLYANNDFTKMLDVMDGTTVAFDGSFSASTLPVEKGYYRLLGKKTIYLRSSGATPFVTAPLPGGIGNNNSHKLVHQFTWDYGKHLPSKLTYPEDNVSVANGQNEPLNSSIFWCLGYFNTDGTIDGGEQPKIDVNMEYTSIMKFKDF